MVSILPRICEFSVEDFFIRSTFAPRPTRGTVSSMSEIGKYYRHPDSAQVAYATTVEQPLGELPKGKDYEIAIVGGGPAGIVALYEISRLAQNLKPNTINVTLYEPDPDHFTKGISEKSVELRGYRAGRVFSVRSKTANGEDMIVYELGAMRFPETASLTWHYAKTIYVKEDEDPEVKPFSNPGTVPTEFVFGNRVDRYMRNEWLPTDSPTPIIAKIIADGLVGNETGDDISMYRIGCKDPAKISEELRSKDTSPERLQEIQESWEEFIEKYNTISLETAVRQIIEKNTGNLPTIEGIEEDTEKINYCVELFGCFGFGTGGMKSAFNMSLIEMIRSLLWMNGSRGEYKLPVEQNVQFISEIYQKSKMNLGEGRIVVKPARVCDVSHSICGEAMIFSYRVGVQLPQPEKNTFDFAILAVPPKQLSAITSRCGTNHIPECTVFGNYPHQTEKAIRAYPPLILSKTQEELNTKIATAIRQLHMFSASKVFASIPKKVYDELTPIFNKAPITAIVSDTGLGSTYIVPSTIINPNNEEEYYSLLLSYTLEDDTTRMKNHFKKYPLNTESDEEHREMVNAMINHTIRNIKDPNDDYKYKLWWFGNLLAKSDDPKNILDCENKLTNWLSYDWTTSYVAGAFKLDLPGGHYNSNLCFRYHTHALNSKLNNRFFIAGESYSHVGGWLEGAFMSAINAVTGLIVAANGGGKPALDALNKEARVIMESLKPIAPEPPATE